MRRTSIRRSWTVVGVFSVVAVISVLGAAISNADENFGFARLAGNDRYDTARDVAAKTFGTSDVVVIASGETFPDALAAAYAAGLPNVPILLTAKNSLPSPTSAAISALKATKAVIIGGTAAVSAAVEQELSDDGIQVTRIAGANRYDTAAHVARSGGTDAVGTTGGPLPPAVPTAIVVSGESFADALSAGPAAHGAHLPILLTPQAGLAPETKEFLADEDYAIGAVLIVGGTAAVSQSVEDEIAEMDIEVTRLAGASRSETATAVADYEIENLEFTDAHVDLARGDGFADALAAGPHGGKAKAPLLLTSGPDTLSDATSNWLEDNAETLKDGHILGGTGAVSEEVEEEAETAGGNTSGTTSSTSSTSSTTSSSVLAGNTDLPGAPAFFAAVLNFTSTPPPPTAKIVVTYTEPVRCASITASDYAVTITDEGPPDDDVEVTTGPVTAAPEGDDPVALAVCGNGSSDTSSRTVTLTPQKIITPRQEGTVSLKSNAQVLDLGNNVQSASDSHSWVGPKFKSTAYSNNGGETIFVEYDKLLDCGTVAPAGADPATSDYKITDKSPSGANSGIAQNAKITRVECSGTTVKISLSETPNPGFVDMNSDNAKVANPKGELQPTDDEISFSTT